MNHKLVFHYSSMQAGKSLALLTKNYMLQSKGFNTLLMKPEIDTRTKDTIATRLGVEAPCYVVPVDQVPSIFILHSNRPKPDYVLVDEVQFFSEKQIWDLADLVDNWGINVICYGLRIDWQGNLFPGSETLFKIADELVPLENICKYEKGMPAFFHLKLGGSADSVEIGLEDLYEAVSRKKWRSWRDTVKNSLPTASE